MNPSKFICIVICFLSVSCGSNEFYIDQEQLIVRGKDSPIRCLEIKNVTSDFLEYYEIKNNEENKRWEICIANPPEGYVITNWCGDTISNIVLKGGCQYAITNRSVFDASSITNILTCCYSNQCFPSSVATANDI